MKHFLHFILFFITTVVFGQNLSQEEKKLYDLIMTYRKTKGLPVIPLSSSLTFVAQTHAKNLADNQPDKGNCNMHSWSKKGKWQACCYTDDHAKAECMWNKPRELTSYKGNGYEIAASASGAEEALLLWKKSVNHNNVIVNKTIWKEPWNAIGIGIFGNYAVVWFGHELDTAKP